MTKIGRNAPCWCGSGKKYKKCHLNREQQPSIGVQEQLLARKASYNKPLCLHPQAGPECGRNIIKAHTIQRNGGLNKIARNGHVYTFFPEHTAMVKGGLPAARLVGLKNASTFTGFCGFHDDEVFTPIEKQPFVACEEHAFLLSYRAICREFYGKRAQLELIPSLREIDKGRPLDEQLAYQQVINDWTSGVRQGMEYFRRYKSIYDEVLLKGDFSPVRFFIVEFDTTPDIMCCGAVQPDYDFAGKTLQDFVAMQDERDAAHLITFTVLATEDGGAVVFSWIGDSDVCQQLVTSLNQMGEEAVPHAVIRFAFQYFENLFASPSWWDGLDKRTQQKLLRRQRVGGMSEPFDTRCLMDDGVRAVSWNVKSRITNLVVFAA